MKTKWLCFNMVLVSLISCELFGFQYGPTGRQTTIREIVLPSISFARHEDDAASQPQEGLKNKVRIAFIEENGSVRIFGNEEDVEIVERAIKRFLALSRQGKPQPTLIPLINAHSQTTAQQILEIYEQQFLAREGPVSITPMDFPSCLLVVGRPGAVDVVRQLAKLFDIDHID